MLHAHRSNACSKVKRICAIMWSGAMPVGCVQSSSGAPTRPSAALSVPSPARAILLRAFSASSSRCAHATRDWREEGTRKRREDRDASRRRRGDDGEQSRPQFKPRAIPPAASSSARLHARARKQLDWGHGQRKESPSAWQPLSTTEMVYGTNPVLSALEAQRRSIRHVYVQEGLEDGKNREVVARVRALAAAAGVPVSAAGKHELNLLTRDALHQGVTMSCSALSCVHLDRMSAALPLLASSSLPAPASGGIWVALDQVMDPQNFGAALRSAAFLGAAGVLTCSRNSSPLSAAVSKASAGVLERVNVHSCASLPGFLRGAAEDGWLVLGAAQGSGVVGVDGLEAQWRGEAGAAGGVAPAPRPPIILVLGNEGTGLRTLVRQTCSHLVEVPLAGPAEAFAQSPSLNVSATLAVLLHALRGACSGLWS